MKVVRVERARSEDTPRLTEIAFAAKRHWGYPETWIQQWREALTITPAYVATNPTFVARLDGMSEIAGFSAVRFDAADAWLDHLWVRPVAMRRGVGRALFEAGEMAVRAAGVRILKIEADPNAELFYHRMGASTTGRTPGFIDGQERYLLLMEKRLA
jgi:GNAT superfamily N-acetyltransferase